MKLENMFDSYRPIISQDEQRFYTVGDLEYLTAGALYERIKKKDCIESKDRNLKFYNLATLKNFGETEVGFQEEGEDHDAYKERMIDTGGYRIAPNIEFGS